MDSQNDMQETLITLTADIVAAHVSNNSVAVSDLPLLIGNVHGALANLGSAKQEPEAKKQEPAVSIRASIKPDYIVCLEDGKKLKMLKTRAIKRTPRRNAHRKTVTWQPRAKLVILT